MFNFKSKKFESDNESNKINYNNNNNDKINNKIKFYPNNIFSIKQFKYNRDEDDHPNLIKIKECENINNVNKNNNKIILNFFDDDINPFLKKYLFYENNFTINNKVNNFEKCFKIKNFNFENINNTIKNIINNDENNNNNSNKLNKKYENIFILYTPNLIDNLNKLNWIFKINSQIFIITNNDNNNNKIITQLFKGMNTIFLNSSNKIKNTIKIFSIFPYTIISTKGFKEDFQKKVLNIQEYYELNINLFYLDNPAIYVENNNIFLILTLI